MVKHHRLVQQYLPLVAVVVEVVTEETVVQVAVLVVTNLTIKEEGQELQVKVIEVVMVLVQVAVVLAVVVVQVLKVVEEFQIVVKNVVVTVAQEYHPLFQELPQRMVVVVVEFHKIEVSEKVGGMVELTVVRLVHLAVVATQHLAILVLVFLVVTTLVVAVVVVVMVVETMLVKVVRVLLLLNGNMNTWPNLKHESSLKNTA
jgi:hypothetical protein